MITFDKAQILDGILLTFKGDKTITWDQMRAGACKKVHSDYFVIENNINFLVGEGMIRREVGITALTLTDKGYGTMTEIDNLGYVASLKGKKSAINLSKRNNNINIGIQILILLVSILAVILVYFQITFHKK